MKCYYEELGIERDAEDADIKNAYRKLALRWHPDKNPDCQEAAKERFQLIQQAYEVLSDVQERAFYDKHREQILRGKNSEYEDKTLDVFQYFSSSCYKGHGDDEKGFFAVYREVFNKIAAEDAEFMDDQEELADIPIFGDSQSSYEEVVGPFYAYWSAYCTKKSYTWLCPYDIQEVKDRRVLRAIEKEMKKVVQNARRERNEEVRSLVSFVRKRDRRVQAYNKLLEERAELNRKKQEQNRREQLLRRRRELEELKASNQQVFDDGYETQLKQLEQQYGQDSDEFTDDEENDDDENQEGEDYAEEIELPDEYFCVACTKAFKNQNAFDNHALSKKHRENEARLKLEMLEEEETLQQLNINGEAESKQESDEEIENLGNKKKLKSKQKKCDENYSKDCDDEAIEEEEVELDDESTGEVVPQERTRKNKKNKKSRKVISNTAEISDEEEETNNLGNKPISDEDCNGDNESAINKPTSSTRKSKKNKKNRKNNGTTDSIPAEEREAETVLVQSATEESSVEDWVGGSSKKSNRKSQAKKQTKQVLEKQNDKANASKSEQLVEKDDTGETAHSCATCHAVFESKNKLFAHLKKTNHSVYLPKPTATAAVGGQKKSKGKRK